MDQSNNTIIVEPEKFDWQEILHNFFQNFHNWRCRGCGKLLAREKILIGALEIKCKSCKTKNLIIFNNLHQIIKIAKEIEGSRDNQNVQ